MDHSRFETMYQQNETPWHHGLHDFNLANVVEQYALEPCKVLDLGCGMGSNAIWLAKHGFQASGFDLSPTAIMRAEAQAEKDGVECSFQVGDFLEDEVDGAPFDFIFDRGCLHCIPERVDKARFAEKAASILAKNGLWLSLIGNADEPPREVGPPRMTAREITATVESNFEILSLTAGVFGDEQEDPPRAWICLMRRRS